MNKRQKKKLTREKICVFYMKPPYLHSKPYPLRTRKKFGMIRVKCVIQNNRKNRNRRMYDIATMLCELNIANNIDLTGNPAHPN